jgi:hypothetical protein
MSISWTLARDFKLLCPLSTNDQERFHWFVLTVQAILVPITVSCASNLWRGDDVGAVYIRGLAQILSQPLCRGCMPRMAAPCAGLLPVALCRILDAVTGLLHLLSGLI